MDNRSRNLLQIRPIIPNVKISSDMSSEERFQSETLRPIIKLQNPLMLSAFRNYIAKHKNTFHELSSEKQLLFIENAIQRDIKFRNSLKGMVIGHLAIEEYDEYVKNSSALNKRMMQMVIERLKDQIQLIALERVMY